MKEREWETRYACYGTKGHGMSTYLMHEMLKWFSDKEHKRK